MPDLPTIVPGSPRTAAAMRVLGILPKDLQARERTEFPDGMPGDVRHQAFETKRRQLMHSVVGLAEEKSLNLAHSASAPQLGQPSDATNAFLADVMAKEAASLAKMRARAQADVQKIVLDEMDIKRKAEERAVKQEELRKRKLEIKKAENEKLKAAQKEAQKKAEKTLEVRLKADRMLQEKCEALGEEVAKKNERIEAMLEKREAGWEEKRVQMKEIRSKLAEGLEKFKSKDMVVKEEAWKAIKKKDKLAEERLAQVRHEASLKQAMISDKTSGVIARAAASLGDAQAVKDAAFLERVKVHAKTAEVRAENAKEYQKYFIKKNKEEEQRFRKNYEAATREAAVIYVSPRLTKSMSGNYLQKPAWKTEGSIKAFETHHTMGELRQVNLSVLHRAHLNAHQQALNKISDVKKRAEALQASKDEAQYRRYDVMKNCAIEKHHLTFQVEKVRDAPPERMNSLLEQMGMQPVKLGGEETEEDAEKK